MEPTALDIYYDNIQESLRDFKKHFISGDIVDQVTLNVLDTILETNKAWYNGVKALDVK